MENLLELLRERGGIFNVKFHKADGTLRSMNARFGVRKGVTGKGLKYNPSERSNIIVYSMKDNGFRTINYDRIVSIKFNGSTFLNKL
jgi:hypothetical protein